MNDDISRREFLKTAGSSALLASLGIQITSCNVNNDINDEGSGISIKGGTVTLDLTAEDTRKLKNEGGWLLINRSGANMLVVNVDGDLIRAFTSICPHFLCNHFWSYVDPVFTCGCHQSRFLNNGELLEGPATKDLDEFQVTRNGDTVIINS